MPRQTAQAQQKPKTEDPKPENNVVPIAPRTMDAVPAHLRSDIAEYAGAGTSERREDSLVPFLYIAQKGSPQVNKRDATYIEGLEPGWIFDTSTGQKWCAEEGNGPLLVQFFFEAAEVEWGLRDSADKGFKGKHPADTPLLTQLREVPKPSGRGITRMLPNGHQLSTTRYHYMILAQELRPVALALSSSSLQASRAVNTFLRNKKVRGPSGLVVAPSFATLLKLRTVWRQDGDYDWFVPVFEDLGWITEEHMDAYEEAKMMFASARLSGVRTAEPPAEDNSDLTGQDPDADPSTASPI